MSGQGDDSDRRRDLRAQIEALGRVPREALRGIAAVAGGASRLPLFTSEQLAGAADAAEAIPETLRAQIVAAGKQFAVMDERLKEQVSELRQWIEGLDDRTRHMLAVLGAHGWYLDMDLSPRDADELLARLEGGDEAALVEHYRTRFSEIQQELTAWHPTRGGVLARAFEAHRRGEYELSVPVLLSQADGICKDLIGAQLYAKRDKRPVTATAIRKSGLDSNSYLAALLHPLTVELPITASEAERAGNPACLNRHAVLHGESVDYGTEINGLKAVSLIHYVACVLRREGPEGGTP